MCAELKQGDAVQIVDQNNFYFSRDGYVKALIHDYSGHVCIVVRVGNVEFVCGLKDVKPR